MKNSKGKKTLVIILLLVILSAAVIAVVLLTSSAKTVNFEDYIRTDIAAKGYNGYGIIHEEDIIDFDALIADLGEKTYGGKDEDSNSSPLKKGINIEIDKKSEIFNGDKITAKISVDYDYINLYDFEKKLHGKEEIIITYTITNLQNQVSIDPFKAIEVNYKFHKIEIKLNDSLNKDVNGFKLERQNDVFQICNPEGSFIGHFYIVPSENQPNDNGEVTLYIKTSLSFGNFIDKDSFASKGVLLSKTSEMVHPVEWHQIKDISELSEKAINDIKDKAVSSAYEETPDNWTNISPENAFYYKNIWDDTYISFLFKCTTEHDDGSSETAFFEMGFCGIYTDGKSGDFEGVVTGLRTYKVIENYDETLREFRSDSDCTEIKF